MKRIKPVDMEKNEALGRMFVEMHIFAVKHKQEIRGSLYLTIDQIKGYILQYSYPIK